MLRRVKLCGEAGRLDGNVGRLDGPPQCKDERLPAYELQLKMLDIGHEDDLPYQYHKKRKFGARVADRENEGVSGI